MEKHNITWRGIGIEITFTPEKFGMAHHIAGTARSFRFYRAENSRLAIRPAAEFEFIPF